MQKEDKSQAAQKWKQPMKYLGFFMAGYLTLHAQHLMKVPDQAAEDTANIVNRVMVAQKIREAYDQGTTIDADALEQTILARRVDLGKDSKMSERTDIGLDEFELAMIQVTNEDIEAGRFVKFDEDAPYDPELPAGFSEYEELAEWFEELPHVEFGTNEGITSLVLGIVGSKHPESFFANNIVRTELMGRAQSQSVWKNAVHMAEVMHPLPLLVKRD